MSKKRWRSLRTARVSPDDVRIRQTAPRTPGSGLSTRSPPGLLRPRSGQTAGVVLDVPARTLTRRTGPVMSATGPDRMFRFPPPWRRLENGCRPGGWLCTVEPDRPPAEPRWPPPPFATCRTLRQIPKGLPPAWSNTFEGPSGSGSGRSMAWGRNVGMKTALIFVRCCGAHPLHPCGGECEFQHLSVS